jgi:hypothetical protein
LVRAKQRLTPTEDLKGLGTADAMVRIIGRPDLETGRDLNADRASAVDEPFFDSRNLGKMSVYRTKRARG